MKFSNRRKSTFTTLDEEFSNSGATNICFVKFVTGVTQARRAAATLELVRKISTQSIPPEVHYERNNGERDGEH